MIATKLPDNTWITNKYSLTGLLTNSFGSRTYPVGYSYDAQGRMKTMTTFKNYGTRSGAATTTWNYDPYRGWLLNKRYPDSTGPNYTNTPAGRLKIRLWARGTTTTYAMNNAGEVASITYSDGTATVTNGYDRRGKVIAIGQGMAVTTKTYNDAGSPLSESYSGGRLSGISVTNGYDNLQRPTNLVALLSGVPLLQHTNSYGPASRLDTVGDGTNSATYSYLANSRLIDHINFANAGVVKMVTTKQWDFLDRLTSIVSATNSVPVASFVYALNAANQRTSCTNVDGSFWVYIYDSLGQVISGKKYWSDGSPVAGQQFEYAFDDIGNRTSTRQGGDRWGANLRSASYAANSLNQYTSRDVPRYVSVLGSATNPAVVTISADNGNSVQTDRHFDYFRGELPVNNSTGAVWLTVTNTAVLHNGTTSDAITNIIGTTFLPQTPETFAFDADGNQTRDGRWTNTWDAENRLLTMVGLASTPTTSKLRLTFGYDTQWRRIFKTVESWNGSAWSVTLSNKFIYDGWNLVAELNGTNNTIIRSYMWGTDVSGTMQSAGGVGGLLAETDAILGSHFVCFDGNGNVMALVARSNGAISGQYMYGPFGQPIRAAGIMQRTTGIGFSSKYEDAENDGVYFGYREYTSGAGRWVSADPIGERGGLSRMSFARNDSINRVDTDGRITFDDSCTIRAQQIIYRAILDVCKKIDSSDFSCCMRGEANSNMMGADAWGLRSICTHLNITVKCAPLPGGYGGPNPNTCATGDKASQTITVYNRFFSSDHCGFGWPCVVGHEMYHLVIGEHSDTNDHKFNREHKCMGCKPYRDYNPPAGTEEN